MKDNNSIIEWNNTILSSKLHRLASFLLDVSSISQKLFLNDLL